MTINKKGVQTDTLFVYGGGGNRTRVREPSVYASYRFSPDLISSSEDPRDRDSDNQQSVDLILPAAGALEEPSHNFTPHQDPWEKSCETSLLFKQRVRSCLRHLIYVQGLLRGSCDLDLRRLTSNLPSKPIRPHLSQGRSCSPLKPHRKESDRALPVRFRSQGVRGTTGGLPRWKIASVGGLRAPCIWAIFRGPQGNWSF